MAVRTCYRCHGTAFLEQRNHREAAWVCLQCAACQYLSPKEAEAAWHDRFSLALHHEGAIR